jgi:hypothetical protein
LCIEWQDSPGHILGVFNNTTDIGALGWPIANGIMEYREYDRPIPYGTNGAAKAGEFVFTVSLEVVRAIIQGVNEND